MSGKKAMSNLGSRLQPVAMWGIAAGTGALWVVQPFDWIKKTFFEKPQAE